MDKDKIAIAISVVAVFLAVPLSIVGNLLTPRVREWYSTTSQARLEKRIAYLEQRLKKSENDWVFTHETWHTYRMQSRAVMALIAIAASLFCSILAFSLTYWLVFPKPADVSPTVVHHVHEAARGVVETFAFPYLLSPFVFSYFLHDYRRTRNNHTQLGRDKLRNEIAKLRALVR